MLDKVGVSPSFQTLQEIPWLLGGLCLFACLPACFNVGRLLVFSRRPPYIFTVVVREIRNAVSFAAALSLAILF